MQRISETPINLARRAERALAAIDAQFVLDLGLIADYGRGSLVAIFAGWCRCLEAWCIFFAHGGSFFSRVLAFVREWEKQTSYLFRECNIFRVHLAPSQGGTTKLSEAALTGAKGRDNGKTGVANSSTCCLRGLRVCVVWGCGIESQ